MSSTEETIAVPPPPEVGLFREILIWPLLIKNVHADRGAAGSLKSLVDLLTRTEAGAEVSPWSVAPADQERHYEEVVYFHPFVRDFLHGDLESRRDVGQRPMRVLARSDVKAVGIQLGESTRELVLDVDRVQLYLFDTRIVLVVVEVSYDLQAAVKAGTGPLLKLDEVMEIQDRFRRVYAPYWEDGVQGHCPFKVRWLNSVEAGETLGDPSDYEAQARFRTFADLGAEPPVAAHWAWLLGPEVIAAFDGRPAGELPERPLAVQQVEDERLPAMCYVALDRPRDLTPGDFVRLGLLDGQGDRSTFPYSKEYLSDFEGTYCYDPFWEPAKDAKAWLSTRYLCCGYGFTMVGDSWAGGFFTNGETGALAHFRRHYFKMGLIAHFHRASLLMFSDRLSDAVKQFNRGASRERLDSFRRDVRIIHEDLLRFRSRFWFTEVSNQVQGQALFKLWTKHLNTRELFDQVLDETRVVNDFLNAREESEQTRATSRLTVVAAVGLVASLALTLFSVGKDLPRYWRGGFSVEAAVQWLGTLGVAFVAFASLMLLVVYFSDPLATGIGSVADWGRRAWRNMKDAESREPGADGPDARREP